MPQTDALWNINKKGYDARIEWADKHARTFNDPEMMGAQLVEADMRYLEGDTRAMRGALLLIAKVQGEIGARRLGIAMRQLDTRLAGREGIGE